MVLDPSNAEVKYNDLLIKELSNLREDIKELRQEVRSSNKHCSARSIECNKQFIATTTYWKMFGITILLIFGAYGFTGAMLQYVIKSTIVL